MIIVSRLVPYSAMAIYPFIFIKKKEMENDTVLIYHERIHHRQQLELLIIPFYILYLFNYLLNLLRYKNHYKAYREIIFEREAYTMENDFEYLNRRKTFGILRF